MLLELKLKRNQLYPNFFIVGAPKCGTTSLANWLSDHPGVFMPKLKEPHFFNTEDSHRNIKSGTDYMRLFSGASKSGHTAIGEASTWYLSSSNAIKNILEATDRARIVVMLRNPLEMAPSLHQQNIYGLYEDIEDFTDAWKAQADRRAGRRIPASCRDARHLLYGEACSLGEQLDRLLELVDREKVHIVYMQDLRDSPQLVYLKVLEFLDLEDDGRNDFSAMNSAKAYSNKWLARVIKIAYRIKIRAGITRSFGMDRSNLRSAPRKSIDQVLQRELCEYFRDDIALLGRLTQRDLSDWLQTEND